MVSDTWDRPRRGSTNEATPEEWNESNETIQSIIVLKPPSHNPLLSNSQRAKERERERDRDRERETQRDGSAVVFATIHPRPPSCRAAARVGLARSVLSRSLSLLPKPSKPTRIEKYEAHLFLSLFSTTIRVRFPSRFLRKSAP